MKDTTSLAAELLDKLSELEQKVVEYRKDMAVEFRRFSDELLRDVPEEVSDAVDSTIQYALPKFEAISPAFDSAHPFANGSPVVLNGTAGRRPRRLQLRSPPPILPHTSGVPPDNGDSRSPHAREEEFHGLFVPSFMPMINGAKRRNSQEAVESPTSATPTSPASPDLEEEPLANGNALTPPPAAEVGAPRPCFVRRPTNDTIVSTVSEDSPSKIRRSALRRSSSSSTKTQSPRRVRFEVGGEEVLPTSSPPKSPRQPDQLSSASSNNSDMFGDPYDSALVEEDDDDDDDEDEEGGREEVGLLGSSPPRAKKASSTDRLKALARTSMEDTSNWQVVGGMQDSDDDDEFLVMTGRNDRPRAPESRQEKLSPLPPEFGGPIINTEETYRGTIVDEANADEEDEEDEDLLDMPQLQSFRDKKNFSPPSSATACDKTFRAPDSTASTEKPSPRDSVQTPVALSSEKFEDEELFAYEPDDDGPDRAPKDPPTRKYITEEEPTEADMDLQDESDPEKTPVGPYSSSPAVDIPQPPPAEVLTPSSRYLHEAVGSYKGRPFTISSIKNEEVQKKAAEMGDFYSFVGSVDGRSGVDASNSYMQQRDMTYFNGTPKSLSERLMMEDFEEKQEQ
jgi:hypothetical protein